MSDSWLAWPVPNIAPLAKDGCSPLAIELSDWVLAVPERPDVQLRVVDNNERVLGYPLEVTSSSKEPSRRGTTGPDGTISTRLEGCCVWVSSCSVIVCCSAYLQSFTRVNKKCSSFRRCGVLFFGPRTISNMIRSFALEWQEELTWIALEKSEKNDGSPQIQKKESSFPHWETMDSSNCAQLPCVAMFFFIWVQLHP